MVSEAVEEVKARARARRGRCTPDTRLSDMLMGLHFSPAPVTGVSGNLLIFVKSQGPVHGRTCGSLNQINEIQASLKK